MAHWSDHTGRARHSSGGGRSIATELAEQGRLRVPIAAAFPLAEAAAAHELSETRHARGRIVLVS